MAVASLIPGEEYFRVLIGQGMYTSELASNIPDGFSPIAYNLVATGDSLENRIGIKRTTVDWKYYENAMGSGINVDTDKMNLFSHLNVNIYNSALPAFGWGSSGLTVPGNAAAGYNLNFVRSYGDITTGDGFMQYGAPGLVTGMAQYRDRTYFSVKNGGVYYINSYNWSTDTPNIIGPLASSTGGNFYGLFTFKDRMWAYQDHLLYFTDIAASGGYPETWAFAANTIPFIGPNGTGRIKKVVPLGNKLVVFTTAGLFTLLVEGAPQSWILRLLDSESISTTNSCAVETKN